MHKRNLIANYIGQGWSALMGLAFVPWYIKYLGIEAYGIIGIFAVLQAWLALIDMGMTPTLSREMGRFKGGAQSAESIRDLLRSVEVIATIVAILVAIVILLSSNWLASDWLKAENIGDATVANALSIMGFVAALRFLSSIYRSSLIGLQNQVTVNLISVVVSTFGGLGAVGVLAWYSPTIDAFFIWHGLISLLTVLLFMASTYIVLPRTVRRGQFSLHELRKVSRYAGGMVGITFLSLLLSQIDKILLTRLLTLSDYGYYSLAAIVSGGLYILLAPIVQAWFPRLSQLHAASKLNEFINAYHQGAQLVSVVLGSAALVLIFHAETILKLWTQDAELARHSASLVRWLTLGNLLNGFMTIPYQAQLAYGWTGYALRINMISVVLIVPAIVMAVPKYGAKAAAIIWVCLNAGYILIAVHLMYSRMLRSEKWRWYREDILQPMIPATLMASSLHFLMPQHISPSLQIIEILLAVVLTVVSAAMGANSISPKMSLCKFLSGKSKLW